MTGGGFRIVFDTLIFIFVAGQHSCLSRAAIASKWPNMSYFLQLVVIQPF